MAPTDVVCLSFCAFAAWWGIILGVHGVTCVYNALYAYCYWELQNTYLNAYLKPFQIGMPPPYHHTIAIVYAASVVHGVCILLMIGGSHRQRSLAFTPWSSCNVNNTSSGGMLTHEGSGFKRYVSKIYAKILDRHGLCGVNSDSFHTVLVCRELVETALQTMQAYRMSALLPRTLLNRFYVILIAVNCWSPVIVYLAFSHRDEARRRLACIVLDCVLDFMACMGVELLVLLSYASEYDPSIRGFDQYLWYDDEWVARALNEFRILVVVSCSDLVSRSIFSMGLVMTTTNMKELLRCLPRNVNRVVESPTTNVITTDKQIEGLSIVSLRVRPIPQRPAKFLIFQRSGSFRESSLKTRGGNVLLHIAHLLFAAWGALVIGFHIHASLQPMLPQCLMQVRPWFFSHPSCYLVGLDCHTLGISGKMEEVRTKWREFDSSTVVQLLIRHCPKLQVPDIFREIYSLRGIKVYNTTIIDWGESAAITNSNHPGLSYLFIVRVNMTDGLLPAGFQSSDFPPTLYDIEICVTNLREMLDDLDTKWSSHALIQVEYSQLVSILAFLCSSNPSIWR